MVEVLKVYCTVLIGANVPLPLPATLTEAIKTVEVMHNDSERSGFQITFTVGFNYAIAGFPLPLSQHPLLQPFNRVKILATLNGNPNLLMDGVITHVQLTASEQPGSSVLMVTGEDISVMMDLKEEVQAYSAQNELTIMNRILAKYAQYNLTSILIPPPVFSLPSPLEPALVQNGTDYSYIQELSKRYGYVFYVEAGPLISVNTAYWGPPQRSSELQKALTVNDALGRNVESIHFLYDSLQPTTVSDRIPSEFSNQDIPLKTFGSTRLPLSRSGAFPTSFKRQATLKEATGTDYQRAKARAQAITDFSSDQVLVARGELDVIDYEGILLARRLVGVRGAGTNFDGAYYVKQVKHTLQQGDYRQSFTLTRDGVGNILPGVVP